MLKLLSLYSEHDECTSQQLRTKQKVAKPLFSRWFTVVSVFSAIVLWTGCQTRPALTYCKHRIVNLYSSGQLEQCARRSVLLLHCMFSCVGYSNRRARCSRVTWSAMRQKRLMLMVTEDWRPRTPCKEGQKSSVQKIVEACLTVRFRIHINIEILTAPLTETQINFSLCAASSLCLIDH